MPLRRTFTPTTTSAKSRQSPLTMSADDIYKVVRLTDKIGDAFPDLRTRTRDEHNSWAVSPDNDLKILLGGSLEDGDGRADETLAIMKHADPGLLSTDPYDKVGLYDQEATKIETWRLVLRTDEILPNALFMIWCVDKQNSLDLRMKTRPAHVQWWKDSKRQGIIGPFLSTDQSPKGSLLLCTASDLEDAKDFAASDPYAKAGLFQSVDVKLFTKAIENNKLIK